MHVLKYPVCGHIQVDVGRGCELLEMSYSQ
jgi:hypothetical protein